MTDGRRCLFPHLPNRRSCFDCCPALNDDLSCFAGGHPRKRNNPRHRHHPSPGTFPDDRTPRRPASGNGNGPVAAAAYVSLALEKRAGPMEIHFRGNSFPPEGKALPFRLSLPSNQAPNGLRSGVSPAELKTRRRNGAKADKLSGKLHLGASAGRFSRRMTGDVLGEGLPTPPKRLTEGLHSRQPAGETRGQQFFSREHSAAPAATKGKGWKVEGGRLRGKSVPGLLNPQPSTLNPQPSTLNPQP